MLEEKLKPDSSPELLSQLSLKNACFILVELMYGALPATDLNGPNAVVNRAYCSPNQPSERGNELNKLLTGQLFAAVSETHLTPMVDAVAELRRVYHCSAYNALAAIIMCTQREEKFFSSFLFKDNPAKAERMLDNLIDAKRCANSGVRSLLFFMKKTVLDYTGLKLSWTGPRR